MGLKSLVCMECTFFGNIVEIFINRIYIVLMFDNAVFFDQWWGHLAMLIEHNRGTKSYTIGMDGFNNWSANLGLKCAYNTIGTWPIILHCCQTTGGSSGFCIGTLVGGEGSVGRPKNSWDTILENFCRLKGLPSWEVAAMDQDLWSSSLAEFLHFCKW